MNLPNGIRPRCLYVIGLLSLLAGLGQPCLGGAASNATSALPIDSAPVTARAGPKTTLTAIADWMTNCRGGHERESHWLSKLSLDIDGTASRTTGFYLSLISMAGGNPSESIGDIQVTSNIEAPAKTTLMQAWLERKFGAREDVLRFGLMDLNWEFDWTVVGGAFLNSSFGVGNELAVTGENGPSIFPTASLGVYGKLHLRRHWFVQGTILDGVPGDLHRPGGTRITLKAEDGALLCAETGYHVGAEDETPEPLRKYVLGGWRYTRKFADLAEVDELGEPRFGTSQGVYGFLAARLFTGRRNPARKVSAFVRYGLANGDVSPTDRFVGAGLTCTDLLRPKDRFGIGLARACNSGKNRMAAEAEGGSVPVHETVVEATWKVPLAEHLSVQPDVQWVKPPGSDQTLGDAMVWTLRFESVFE